MKQQATGLKLIQLMTAWTKERKLELKLTIVVQDRRQDCRRFDTRELGDRSSDAVLARLLFLKHDLG